MVEPIRVVDRGMSKFDVDTIHMHGTEYEHYVQEGIMDIRFTKKGEGD